MVSFEQERNLFRLEERRCRLADGREITHEREGGSGILEARRLENAVVDEYISGRVRVGQTLSSASLAERSSTSSAALQSGSVDKVEVMMTSTYDVDFLCFHADKSPCITDTTLVNGI